MKKDNKTIGITIRFFTNALPDRVGKDREHIPFWGKGSVHIEANRTKGIKAQSKPFNRIEDIPDVLADVMQKARLASVSSSGYGLRRNKK